MTAARIQYVLQIAPPILVHNRIVCELDWLSVTVTTDRLTVAFHLDDESG